MNSSRVLPVVPVVDGDPGAALLALRAGQVAEWAGLLAQAEAVLGFVLSVPVGGEADRAGWGLPGCDELVPLGGVGTPWVSEFAVAEIGAVLGVSGDAARSLVGELLELVFRLPRCWSRVQSGEVPLWRARRVASETIQLGVEGADWVDRQLAACVGKVSSGQRDRVVRRAIRLYEPELEALLQESAREARTVVVDLRGNDGLGTVWGRLNVVDARDVEDAVAAGAAALADAGCEESLGARRARALGELARGEQVLGLVPREVTMHVHLESADLVRVDGVPGLVPAADLAPILAGARVTLRPVVDLVDPGHDTTSYTPGEVLARAVRLRDQHCVFPGCGRSARSADLDHIEPYGAGGTTSAENLACLCRFHHRVKTHGGWSYRQVKPGDFEWVSPHGWSFARTG